MSLANVYGPVPLSPVPLSTPLALVSKVIVIEILSPSVSANVIPLNGVSVALSFTACPATAPVMVGAALLMASPRMMSSRRTSAPAVKANVT